MTRASMLVLLASLFPYAAAFAPVARSTAVHRPRTSGLQLLAPSEDVITPLGDYILVDLQVRSLPELGCGFSNPRLFLSLTVSSRTPALALGVPQSIPSQTEVGILLPTTFMNEFDDAEFLKPECRAGVVKAMGPGAMLEDSTRAPMPDFKVGQKVIVGPEKGERVQLDGQSLQESTLFLFKAEEIWSSI